MNEIPWQPRYTQPFYQPSQLTSERVDPGIWPAVQLINQCGWVWTAESCEGHPSGWSEQPMIRLVSYRSDIDWIGVLFDSLPDRGFEPVRIQPMTGAPSDWIDMRVYGPDIDFFDRFAALVL